MRDIFEYKDNFAKYATVRSELRVGYLDNCQNPIISVIMPVYKRPHYFKLALKSVLNQDFDGQYEIVVVDNNTDEGDVNENQRIVQEAKSEKILYYRNEKNIGMFGNWNRGIELSRGKYVTYCHDDDQLLPNALSTLLRANGGKSNRAVFASFNKIDQKGEYISKASLDRRKLGILKPRNKYKYSVFDVFLHSPGYGCGCLFSKDKLIEIGGYSEDYYPSSDYALNAIYIVKNGAVFSQIPTFNYRIAENESLTVYDKFIEVDNHFRKGMKKYIHLPDALLDRIILANSRLSEIRFAIMWGKKDLSLRQKEKISDKIIMKIMDSISRFKRYKIL